MNINVSTRHLTSDDVATLLVNNLRQQEEYLQLDKAQIYFQFPILKDIDDSLLVANLLIVSPYHGLLVVGLIRASSRSGTEIIANAINNMDEELEHIYTQIFARLIKNKNLGSARQGLNFKSDTFIYAPYIADTTEYITQSRLLNTISSVNEYFAAKKTDPIPDVLFKELISTLEGAKGLIRPKARTVPEEDKSSKGYLANLIEFEISSFDQRQKTAYMTVGDGLERIRGLAGSGKTVVLAMKAAITHLRYPDANIVYTFYTRSLYQHVRRLITRFYRQFDDKDPDWNRLHVLHAWGGQTMEGVYSRLSLLNGTQPLTYTMALRSGEDAFDFACKSLLGKYNIAPCFDYCFMDEGQDFPASFFQLCIKSTRGNRVTFAYDDLQTIFQAATPTLEQIIGSDADGNPALELKEDTILYKCYRNPREILVCAHALGFGIYGNKIVQMLENRDQWKDIGYEVEQGQFSPGSPTQIRRPEMNNLKTISENQTAHEIIQVNTYDSYSDEILNVVANIQSDLEAGLRPEDIVVIVVDDSHAKQYLRDIESELGKMKVACNNIHSDSYYSKDFHMENTITLTTVHKAKGNEGFMIYVVGIDALFASYVGVRQRNLIFTAMTRAKGWIRLSGIGANAESFKEEISKAMSNLPLLKFNYPSAQRLKVIKRDLAEKDIRKYQSMRKMEEAMNELELSPEDVENIMKQRGIKKGL